MQVQAVFKAIVLGYVLFDKVQGIYGVPEDQQSLYEPDKNNNWACLGHPEIIISFDKVNDDWCDCPDGSDEPGTNACPNSYFYCENKGHVPRWISSSLVGDGICDYDVCCDGSDENSMGHVQCPNRCKEVNKQYQQELEQLTDVWQKGYAIKQDLIKQSEIIKADLQATIEKNTQNLVEVQQQIPGAEDALKEAQALDKANGSAEEVSLPEEVVNAKELASKLADTVDNQINLLATKLETKANKLNELLETMKSDYNPNFNDPAVKAAIRGWEEIQAAAEDDSSDSSLVESLVLLNRDLNELRSELEKFTPEPVVDNDSFLHQWVPKGLHSYLDDTRTWLEQNGILAAANRANKKEGKLTADARTRLEAIQNQAKQLEDAINDAKNELDRNYGPQDALRALKDVCIEDVIGEYSYKVCFFGSTEQTGHGQHGTNLGRYSEVKVDQDTGIISIDYDNGARCWNGPIRTSHVEFKCGSEHKVISVTEPEKCEYFFLVESPIGCGDVPPKEMVEADQKAHLATHALGPKKQQSTNEHVEHSDL